jgi:chemotaxis protein CheZ
MAPAALSRATKAQAQHEPPPPSPDLDVQSIARELASVADYIKHVRREIGMLRPNELCRDGLPSVHQELGSVVTATASATHTIMTAAEEILGSQEPSPDEYRNRVESKLLEIFEACSFQDITGQRIGRVVEALSQIEKRLGRFADAVRARDTNAAPDPEETLRQARREMLLLNGPQDLGRGIAQDDIDRLFD